MRTLLITILSLCLALPALAKPISFASGWKEQRLSLFSSNDYRFGERLEMTSDGAISIAWTRVARDSWGATGASWRWQVDRSVPATDLSIKGGDDRNISFYFVFVPGDMAPALEGANIRRLLGNPDVRIIQYAYGGDHPRGTLIPSPYGPPDQAVTIVLRPAGTGAHTESVDLAADYARAFAGEKGALVGLAISGDSDDTESVIEASLSALMLRQD